MSDRADSLRMTTEASMIAIRGGRRKPWPASRAAGSCPLPGSAVHRVQAVLTCVMLSAPEFISHCRGLIDALILQRDQAMNEQIFDPLQLAHLCGGARFVI